MAWDDLIESDLEVQKPARAVSFAQRVWADLRAVAAALAPKDLGGSLIDSPGILSGWQNVVNWRPVRLSLLSDNLPIRNARVWTRTLASGTSVNWRIVRSDDDSVILATGSMHNSTVRTEQIVAISPLTEGHEWVLQQWASNASNPVYAMGQIDEAFEP